MKPLSGKRPVNFILLTKLLLLLFSLPTFANTKSENRIQEWPTTEFKVIHHEPIIRSLPQAGGLAWIKDALRRAALGEGPDQNITATDAAWSRLVEAHLRDIARRYQETGFEPPDLQLVEHEGREKYVIYLYDFKTSRLAAKSKEERNAIGIAFNVFGDDQHWIAIDRARFTYPCTDIPDSKREPNDPCKGKTPTEIGRTQNIQLYSTLAHELFHALQGVYDRKYGSIDASSGALGTDVVVEGGADGAAMYLISKKFPEYLEKDESNRNPLGGFNYRTRFLDAIRGGNPNPYDTGSLWFHLGERFGSLSVIEYILRRRLQGRNVESRLRWLDGALKDHPGIQQGLYTIFPHFITELASYGVGRYERVSAPVWEYWILSGCDYAMLTPEDEIDAEVVYDTAIPPIGSRCVQTVWSGFPPDGQLKIEAIGPDRDALDQLNLGIASGNDDTCWGQLNEVALAQRKKNTCVLEKLFVQTGPGSGKWSKTWELAPGSYGAKGRAIFVLSNVAVNPWETKEVNGVTIRFAFARTESPDKKLAPPEAEHLRMPPPPQMREMLYGIKDKKPIPGTQLPDIRIPTIEITGSEPELLESFLNLKGNRNRRNSQREYRVRPDFTKPLKYGYTGPFYGVATIHDPAASGMSMISSQLCDPERAGDPIGEVLYIGEEQIKVHVKTDLCEMKVSITPPFVQSPVKIDHLDAVIVLPFGWRYFHDKAPVDIITPGVDIFISRYHQRMRDLWGPQWMVSAGAGGAGGGNQPPVGGSDPAGGSRGKAVIPSGCDCSCESFARMKELAKKRDAQSQAELKKMAACSVQCISQWSACPQ